MADNTGPGFQVSRRARRYETALRRIRQECGGVCDNYDLCDHRSCADSYKAWAIADAALHDGRELDG